MGQSDRSLAIVIVEPDERARRSLANADIVGLQFTFVSPDVLKAGRTRVMAADALVVAVDHPSGLDLVAAICARTGAPPVIATGGQGHDGKSLEHVLLRAELRGAACTVIKPCTPQELAAAAFDVCNRPTRTNTAREAASSSGGIVRRAGRQDWRFT